MYTSCLRCERFLVSFLCLLIWFFDKERIIQNKAQKTTRNEPFDYVFATSKLLCDIIFWLTSNMAKHSQHMFCSYKMMLFLPSKMIAFLVFISYKGFCLTCFVFAPLMYVFIQVLSFDYVVFHDPGYVPRALSTSAALVVVERVQR